MSAPTVEFRVLGAVEMYVDGRGVPLGHARQRQVLAALLVEANRPVPADTLRERVWGDGAPQGAQGSLHTYVSRLRRTLGAVPDTVIRRGTAGYVLTVDPDAVDLHLFRRLVGEARAADDDAAAGLLTRALDLWRGEAFATLDSPWLAGIRTTLDGERMAAELDRNDAALHCGRHADLVTELAAAAVAHPWDERLAAQVMVAMYRCGRQAEALEHYRAVRARLADELGADPGPALQQTFQRIVRADPTLTVTYQPPRAATDAPGPDPRGPIPRQLPASSPSFVGRAAELDMLDLLMGPDPGRPATVLVSAIGGAGGIGKTWLALRWAHRNSHRFPDGQLYANLRGFEPATAPVEPRVVLRRFLDALGVEPARMPADLDGLEALYRSLVAGRRMLIVLDNVRDAATVAPLLPGSPTCAVLVTSRHRLPTLVSAHGARPLALDVLAEAEALDLLAAHIGAARLAAEPSAARSLLRHCAGLPLALGTVAARAVLEPGIDLRTLAAELDAAAGRLDALDADAPETGLRSVLSCSVRAVTPAAARFFALLGSAPGPDIGVAAGSSLAALPAASTRTVLRELVAAHLVQEHPPGRYRMHDLVRLYATELAGRDEPERGRAVRRLLDHYLHTAHRAAMLLSPHRDPLDLPEPVAGAGVPPDPSDLDAAMAWFDAEYPALIPAIRLADECRLDVHAWQLPWTLATYCDRRGHWQDWAAAQRIAIDATGRTGDLEHLAQAHRLAANAYSNLRDVATARDHLDESLRLYEHLGDGAAGAHVQFDLALLSDREGRPEQALGHARRSLDLYRGSDAAPIKVAVALNAVGWYLGQLGRYREAVDHCREALAIAQRAESPYGQANTWDSLGYAYHHLGQHDEAISCYRQAVTLFHGMGDRHAEALTLDHLGDSQQATGDRAAAHDTWRRAADTLTELGHPDAGTVRAKLSSSEVA
ncbi:AfsR/SARP family transcriptional regulator [Virgisporangium aurantiacum]|nr:BTAD domain-containing putative transcriptional regulator [Virgisporangium aurantiacum]